MGTVSLPIGASNSGTNDWSDVHGEDQAIIDQLNGSVDATNLAANAVTTTKITDANVTTAKIANDAVTVAKLTPNIVVAGCSGDLTLTGSEQDVAGCTVTTTVAGDYLVRGYFDFTLGSITAAAWTLTDTGRLSVNAVIQTPEALFHQGVGALGAAPEDEMSSRAVVTQEWYLTGVGAGQVIKMRALREGATGGAVGTVQTDGTRLVVQQVA